MKKLSFVALTAITCISWNAFAYTYNPTSVDNTIQQKKETINNNESTIETNAQATKQRVEAEGKSEVNSTLKSLFPNLTACLKSCTTQSCALSCREAWNGSYCTPRTVAVDCQGMNCTNPGKIKCLEGYCVCPGTAGTLQ